MYFELCDFFQKRNVLVGNQVRFKLKKCERYKSLIAFIYFLYTLLALNYFIQTGHRDSSVLVNETGHGMAVVNFNGFSVVVYFIFDGVIAHADLKV